MIRAIAMRIGTLRHPEASAADKAEALKFLGHFVGDVHQPLHAGRAEDRGGTTIKVRFLGKETILHVVWDGDLTAGMALDWRALAERLHASILDAERVTWRRSDVHDWAEESRQLKCLIPGFDGADFSREWKEAPWDRFTMGAPRRQRRSVERYNIVKRA